MGNAKHDPSSKSEERPLRRAPKSLSLAVLCLVGLLAAGTLVGGTRVTPIAGTWRGGGHLLKVSGSLESGFSVAAGESWSIIGCPVKTGDVLSRYTPRGGSTYDAMYLWTENTNGKCANSTRGPEKVTVVLSGSSSLVISGCGYAFCASLTRVGPPPGSTKPTGTKPAATTPAKKDTSAPRVKALTKGLTHPGTRARLQFTVRDDSGHARVTVVLFQGGEVVGKTTSGWGPANGSTWWWDAALGRTLVGPLYFCVAGEDQAGNKSARSCAWISLIAPIARVSNTCGGAGWDLIEKAQHYLGNWHSYQESVGHSYRVNFAKACNLHDAGYGGYTVADNINGGYVDMHSWSRPHVDRKFLGDMRKLCSARIPPDATNAREKCYSTGGTLSIGALALYNFVEKHGWRFFDADLTTPGIQQHGHRENF